MFANLLKKKEPLIKVSVTVYVEEDEGVYYAYSPTMPGLHVEGETEEEVQKNVREAVIAYLVSLVKHNEPLPIGTIVETPTSNARPYSFTENFMAFAN